MTSILAGRPASLSRDFTLNDLCRTESGLPNEPTKDTQLASLILLASRVLQPIRDQFGPLVISSGFRSQEVNAAVKGSANSQHMRGEAADIITQRASTREVFLWLVKSQGIPLGQLIHERPDGRRPWVHVSLPRKGKEREHLVWDGKQYVAFPGSVT